MRDSLEDSGCVIAAQREAGVFSQIEIVHATIALCLFQRLGPDLFRGVGHQNRRHSAAEDRQVVAAVSGKKQFVITEARYFFRNRIACSLPALCGNTSSMPICCRSSTLQVSPAATSNSASFVATRSRTLCRSSDRGR